jgi:DNA-binding MarR family transcriptional regulator
MIKLDHQVLLWVMPKLVAGKKKASSPAAFIVYLYLWYVAQDNRDWIANVSYKTIADNTGLSKSSAQKAIKRLHTERLVESRQPDNIPTATPEHHVLRPWR